MWLFQIDLRRENEMYLQNHPEIKQLFDDFLTAVLEKQPENVKEFAFNFFTNAANKS